MKVVTHEGVRPLLGAPLSFQDSSRILSVVLVRTARDIGNWRR